jgi:hypothetical protein
MTIFDRLHFSPDSVSASYQQVPVHYKKGHVPHAPPDGKSFKQENFPEETFTVIDKTFDNIYIYTGGHSHNSLQDHFPNPMVSPRHLSLSAINER